MYGKNKTHLTRIYETNQLSVPTLMMTCFLFFVVLFFWNELLTRFSPCLRRITRNLEKNHSLELIDTKCVAFKCIYISKLISLPIQLIESEIKMVGHALEKTTQIL